MSRPPLIIALPDANVLYPAPLRDYLLQLASLGVYEPIANLKDFPLNELSFHAVRAEHPDAFISECIVRDSSKAIKALENQVKSLKNPPIPVEKVLKNLEANGLIASVAKLRSKI
jgi:hypothetical protein